MKRARQHPCATPADQEGKLLDFLGHKLFSSANLQFCISNYLALFTKYDFLTYGKLVDFTHTLPQQDQACFQTILKDEKLVARITLEVAVDMATLLRT